MGFLDDLLPKEEETKPATPAQPAGGQPAQPATPPPAPGSGGMTEPSKDVRGNYSQEFYDAYKRN